MCSTFQLIYDYFTTLCFRASDNNEVFDLYDLEDYLNFFTSPENIIEEMV